MPTYHIIEQTNGQYIVQIQRKYLIGIWRWKRTKIEWHNCDEFGGDVNLSNGWRRTYRYETPEQALKAVKRFIQGERIVTIDGNNSFNK